MFQTLELTPTGATFTRQHSTILEAACDMAASLHRGSAAGVFVTDPHGFRIAIQLPNDFESLRQFIQNYA